MLHHLRHPSRLLAVLGMVVLCAVGASAVAFADLVKPDGDTARNGLSPLKYSADQRACDTRGTAAPGEIVIDYTGNAADPSKHYQSEEALDVTLEPEVAGITASAPGSPAVEAGWATNDDTMSIPVETTVDSSVPDGDYKVYVDVVGKVSGYSAKDDAGGRPFYLVQVACDDGGGGGGQSAPVVTYDSALPDANSDGWNNSDVTVTWTITHTGPYTVNGDCGTDADSDGTYAKVLSNETTTAGVTLACVATDASDSTLQGSDDSRLIKLDKTNPTVDVTGVADGGTYPLGTVPAAGCDTDDTLSGVKTAATTAGDTGGGNGVGLRTVTCSGAEDVAGNTGSKTVTYTVKYPTQGGSCIILQPINCDNSSVFSRGKSVPVKFRIPSLSIAQMAALDPSAWRVIVREQTSCTITQTSVNEPDVPTVSNQGGEAPRWSTDQFVYNADLRSMVVGKCYQAQVIMDDATQSSPATRYWSAVFKLQK